MLHLSITATLFLLVAGAPGQERYRHFSLLTKEPQAVSLSGVIEKTNNFTWESRGAPTNWTQIVETGLILEYERMQSFISESYFDVSRFDFAVPEISRAFSGLMGIARVHIFRNDQLYRQFGNCIKFFDEMVAATQILMAPEEPLATTFDTLIANLVDLYIRLLSIHDVQGTLDKRISDLYESIQDFYDEFSTWSREFWALSDIPAEKRLLFQEYSSKIERKMKDAIGQLSRCMPQCAQMDSV
ncbi:hypothetical protein HF325_006325 [Metschnikowia pulcherrima]|uniref:Uncharacterized protein n=1 Tax=Metschnikowia pulcherrima TaxID=27326 RepID=A0A8H7GLJ9_9ASCO|nr:hypothetical protein HF325_006325 [Metschnikowia pulcherrima]